ncbi:MAG TPA: hypothetical protein VKX16_10715 [Chloroflexota bacterium]|nr:hypothetical protein [Chloroflexota bacterium]
MLRSYQRTATVAFIGLALALSTITQEGLRHIASAAVPPSRGTQYLYVQNGLPVDSISGFALRNGRLVPTPGSPYATGGGHFAPTGSANDLATSLANGACAFNTESKGQVESFAVNLPDGALTVMSQIQVGNQKFAPAGAYVTPDGSLLFVIVTAESGEPSWIYQIPIGSSCALGTPIANFFGYKSYSDLAIVGNSMIAAVDSGNNRIDLYQVGQGPLQLVESVPSQFHASPAAGAAIGATKRGAMLFTGQIADGWSSAEAFWLTGKSVQDVPSSPLTDSAGSDGLAVHYDPFHDQLVESEGLSGSLGLYSFSGGPGKVVHVATSIRDPGVMAQLGSDLFVLGYADGTVNLCALGRLQAHCGLAVTLPANSRPAGVAVLSVP